MNIKKDEDKTFVQQETLDESAISDAKKSFEERDLAIDVEKNYVKDECREALLRFKTIHNPRYLIAQGMVPDTSITRSLASFIKFCHHRPDDDPLWRVQYDKFSSCVIDETKLSRILQHMYGVYVEDVFCFFSQRRVADLMCYVEEYASPAYQVNWEAFEEWKKERKDELQEMFMQHNMGKSVRLEWNIDDIGMNTEVFFEDIYYRYHLIVSPFERLHLYTFEEITDYILFRLWDGGAFCQPFNDVEKIAVCEIQWEEIKSK